jgi:hypothetical protein
MEGTAKETVIIVHGTWAAPKGANSKWYQPVTGVPTTQPFAAKLNAALQERGSPARCWAHCGQGNQIFHWSGENSWIARTRAASALADYVVKLLHEGWQCHVIAHSHGGNIVLEALSQMMTVPNADSSLGKIVTLGTPFIDMSARQEELNKRFGMKILFSCAMIGYFVVYAVAWIIGRWSGLFDMRQVFFEWLGLFVPLLLLLGQWLGHWGRRTGSGSRDSIGVGQTGPRLLAISSSMDETWQILHHLQTSRDPLDTRANFFRFVYLSMQRRRLILREISLLDGAKSFRDLGLIGKLIVGCLHLVFYLWMVVVFGMAIYSLIPIWAAIVLLAMAWLGYVLLRPLLGDTFRSAFLSPYRRCARVVRSVDSVGTAIVTWIVRRWGWSVLLGRAMGLEGYSPRFRAPVIEKHPSCVPPAFVKYENMPEGAEQRALLRRTAWVGRYLGDVSETFSKMAVTQADTTYLLRMVEADQALVHGAYYSDDECIARIADWIAGRG